MKKKKLLFCYYGIRYDWDNSVLVFIIIIIIIQEFDMEKKKKT